MTESLKTAVFFVLAVVCLAAAYLSRPAVPDVKMDAMVGKVLFPNFIDPLAVKKLEITHPNAAGDIERFAISEVNGIWSIPSHENYPADAKEQMGRLTEALVGLKVLALAPNIETAPDPAPLYTLYGVVEPVSNNNAVPEGAGVKVRLAGENDTTLAELIIGKETKQKEASEDTPPGTEESPIHYIRVVGQTPVYEAAIDLSRFSTSFDQWIEKNLLDVSSYDVKEVFVDEYSLKIDSVITQNGIRSRIAPNFIGDILLAYDGSKTGAEKWNLSKWMKTQGETFDYVEQKLSADQELNADILDSMLTAMNDLKIVNVSKKPSVLAAALREGKPLEKIEDDSSLQRSGFYLVSMPDLKGDKKKTVQQMLSNEGNLQIRMKDGIRYTLRFGDLTGTESEIAADDAKKEEDKKENKETSKDVKMGENRYLFITADFDETAVAKPDLKPIPELPKEGTDEVKKTAAAEKEQLEKSNQREKDRYDEAVDAGKKRAKKLTDRFADWYYVIPEDVYKKIHLTDANVFRAKKKEENANPAHGEPGHIHLEGEEHHHPESPAKPAVKPELPTLPGMEK